MKIRLAYGQLEKSGGRGCRAPVSVGNLHEASSEKNDGVDQSYNPFVSARTREAELFMERQVGTVGSSLVPTLSGGANGTEADRVPQHKWAVPLVVSFIEERITLVGLELTDHLKSLRITGDKSCSAKELSVLRHAVRLRPLLGIGDGLFLGFKLCRRRRLCVSELK